MIAAAACGLLSLALLFYVFVAPMEIETRTNKSRLDFLRERKDSVYENLRDLNFEYKAGKLPEADYQTLRASLEDDAAAILAEIDVLEKALVAGSSAS